MRDSDMLLCKPRQAFPAIAHISTRSGVIFKPIGVEGRTEVLQSSRARAHGLRMTHLGPRDLSF